MKYKAFPLVLVAILMASLAVVGCGPVPAEFVLSNLTISPGSVYPYDSVTISVDVSNIGGVNGSCTANLSVNGVIVDTEAVLVEAAAVETVTFTYTPEAEGNYTIAIGALSGTLEVEAPLTGYWTIPYQTTGGEIFLRVSLLGAEPDEFLVDFPPTTMTVLISKAVTDGAREFIIDGDSFVGEPAFVPDVQLGIDMDLYLTLSEDAVGTLYVSDGIGDVDVTSETAAGRDPQTVSTFGDGTLDPAGSLLLDLPLVGFADTTMGVDVELPMAMYMTTGHSYDQVSRPGKGLDGAETEGDGVPFAEAGGVASYVGTGGTLVATGGAVNQFLASMAVDFQFRLVMEIEPVAGWQPPTPTPTPSPTPGE